MLTAVPGSLEDLWAVELLTCGMICLVVDEMVVEVRFQLESSKPTELGAGSEVYKAEVSETLARVSRIALS
jgi:hypothetical protein